MQCLICWYVNVKMIQVLILLWYFNKCKNTWKHEKETRAIRDMRLTKSTLMTNFYDKQTQGGEAQ